MFELNKFGMFLRENRIRSGYKSQRDLAKASGISSATISRIEAGIQEPSIETLSALAKCLSSTTLNEMIRISGIEVVNDEVEYWKKRALMAESEVERLKNILNKIKCLIEKQEECPFMKSEQENQTL